jgi:hypothetical protein
MAELAAIVAMSTLSAINRLASAPLMRTDRLWNKPQGRYKVRRTKMKAASSAGH